MGQVDQTDIICKLQTETATALKHYRHAQTPQEPLVLYAMIPVSIQDKARVKKEKLQTETKCNKRILAKDMINPLKNVRNKHGKKTDRCKEAPQLIFPEMRAGILYSKCCCLHRNGLQDYCPLSQCQGQPECLTQPWADCPPAKYIRLRHSELYPKISKINCTV